MDVVVCAFEAFEHREAGSYYDASFSKREGEESYIKLGKLDNSYFTSSSHASFSPHLVAMKRIKSLELKIIRAQRERDEAIM